MIILLLILMLLFGVGTVIKTAFRLVFGVCALVCFGAVVCLLLLL